MESEDESLSDVVARPEAVLWVDQHDRPVYRSGRSPEHLATRRQLRADGLSMAGLAPVAWLHYSALHGICPLYDPRRARPVRALTERQHAALAEGRRRAHQADCGDCGDTMPWHSAWGPRPTALCRDCKGLRKERAAEAAAAERRRRRAEDRAEATEWARAVLADADAVILDSETTGLDGYAVELAVLSVSGTVLLDTLIQPHIAIPSEATAIHGIHTADMAGAPAFDEVEPQLAAVLAGKRVIVYNAEFDTSVLRRELDRHHRSNRPTPADARPWQDHPDTSAWLGRARWECAMKYYAQWYGEWHPYFGSYTWQPLNGGHRALGDCYATLDRLREIAAADETIMEP